MSIIFNKIYLQEDQSLNTPYIHTHNIYIYWESERERERDREGWGDSGMRFKKLKTERGRVKRERDKKNDEQYRTWVLGGVELSSIFTLPGHYR